MPAKRPRTRAPSRRSLLPARDPEVLDAQATARLLGISTHAVYALFKKGELPGRKVARRWLTTRELVLGWLKGASEQDTLARALANSDQQAIPAALTSGQVQVKKRTSSRGLPRDGIGRARTRRLTRKGRA
jgi:hypothetical protein